MSYYKSIDFISRCNQTNEQTNDERIIPHFINVENFNNIQSTEDKQQEDRKQISMKWTTNNYLNPRDPDVWGPSFWFTLHNGAINYPLKPNNLCKERMKKFILNMDVMIPCEKCADHAISFVKTNIDRLDIVVNCRDNLFKFFVDFHNIVNKRYNKPFMSYVNAYKLYSCSVSVSKMSYK